MDLQLTDKVAVVTGASKGIGLAVTRTLVEEGAIVVAGSRRIDSLAGLERVTAVAVDLGKPDAPAELIARAVDQFGGIDVLVNNAGIATHMNTEDITLKYWRDALDINITAPFLCSREAIRIMKAQTPQGGRIINIGSISAKTPRPDSLPYTTTKFGLQGMTHQLTMDGRKHNIVASIIHPGSTLSSFITRTGRTKAGPGEKPEDYVMAAEEIARVAVLMAALPPEVNLYEATILPNHARSFIGRG